MTQFLTKTASAIVALSIFVVLWNQTLLTVVA